MTRNDMGWLEDSRVTKDRVAVLQTCRKGRHNLSVSDRETGEVLQDHYFDSNLLMKSIVGARNGFAGLLLGYLSFLGIYRLTEDPYSAFIPFITGLVGIIHGVQSEKKYNKKNFEKTLEKYNLHYPTEE